MIVSPFWGAGILLASSIVTQPLCAPVKMILPLIKHIPAFFVTVILPADALELAKLL